MRPRAGSCTGTRHRQERPTYAGAVGQGIGPDIARTCDQQIEGIGFGQEALIRLRRYCAEQFGRTRSARGWRGGCAKRTAELARAGKVVLLRPDTTPAADGIDIHGLTPTHSMPHGRLRHDGYQGDADHSFIAAGARRNADPFGSETAFRTDEGRCADDGDGNGVRPASNPASRSESPRISTVRCWPQARAEIRRTISGTSRDLFRTNVQRRPGGGGRFRCSASMRHFYAVCRAKGRACSHRREAPNCARRDMKLRHSYERCSLSLAARLRRGALHSPQQAAGSALDAQGSP